MEFDDNFFNASIQETNLAQVSTREAFGQSPAQMSTDQLQGQYHPNNHYPTPTSANMESGQCEKTFMSPFPNNYQQKYPSVNTDAQFSDLDELLFTPMLSPAMTPMQQHSGPRTGEVDWEHFDENMFALTAPAMDNAQQAQNTAKAALNGPVQKKQRVLGRAGRTSHNTSPNTPYMNGLRHNGSVGYNKRDTSMAAPALPVHTESSTDSNDGVSPVELDHFSAQTGVALSGIQSKANRQGQPITPSMLMSLQSRNSMNSPSINQGLTLDLAELPGFSMSLDAQNLQTPPAVMLSPGTQQPGTPRYVPVNTNHPAREIKPRPIAPAHSRTKSVSSSPALLPQGYKASPELRPILPGGMSPQVGAMLASKSNYQHIVDGTYDQLNISYPQGMTHGLEVRKTSHKAAEQKRRDHLKECFELMRTILPDRPEAGASKVAILKKGYEHILQLHSRLEAKDAEMASLKAAVATANGNTAAKVTANGASTTENKD